MKKRKIKKQIRSLSKQIVNLQQQVCLLQSKVAETPARHRTMWSTCR